MSTSSIIRVMGDVGSFWIVVGTLTKILPPLAALVTIMWVGFQFYHSEPIKQWRLQRKEQNGNS